MLVAIYPSLTLREVQALLPVNLFLATQVFGKEVCCALCQRNQFQDGKLWTIQTYNIWNYQNDDFWKYKNDEILTFQDDKFWKTQNDEIWKSLDDNIWKIKTCKI